MEVSYWTRSRLTRRGLLRGAGMAAGALTLAPAIAACRGSSAKQSGGTAVRDESALRPVKGGTLIGSIEIDVSNLDYAFAADGSSTAVIADCVEPLLAV